MFSIVCCYKGHWILGGGSNLWEQRCALWRLMQWPELRPGSGSTMEEGGSIDLRARTNKPAGQGATSTL